MFFMDFSSDVSNFYTLLDKEDVTLTEILDESDVIQECKSQNKELIDFLIRPENLERLIDYVVSKPPEEEDQKTQYKYPHVSCEILSCDVIEIIEPIVQNKALLDKIWSFVEQDPPLNPLLASFFGKVLIMIFGRRNTEAFEYMKSRNAVDTLLLHIETSAIMQLFIQMMSTVESKESKQVIAEWLNREKLIEKLIAGLHPKESREKHYNVSQLLCELVLLSRSTAQACLDNDPLMATLERRETISLLLDNMFADAGSNSESSLVEGIAILLSLVEPRKPTVVFFSPFDCPEDPLTPPAAERIAQGVHTVLEAVAPRLEDFHKALSQPPQMNSMPTTAGMLNPPLGKVRLHITWLMKAIVITDTPFITEELIRLSTLNVMLDLFFKYQWNNFLHTHIMHCLSAILMSEPHPGNENQMLKHLIKDCHLTTRILDAWEEDHSRRKGYMGHLTNLFNAVSDTKTSGASSSILEEVFSELPEENQTRWSETVSGSLAELNKINTAPVASINDNKLHSSSEDEEEYRPESSLHLGSSLHQEFANYHMQQMTDEFVESFGYNEDDLQNNDTDDNPFDDVGNIDFSINAKEETSNAAVFEAVCNQKIHQCNDTGSDDEEMWEEKELSYSSAEESKHSKPGSDGDEDDSAFHNNNDSYRDSHSSSSGSSSDGNNSDEDRGNNDASKDKDVAMERNDELPAVNGQENGPLTNDLDWNDAFESDGVAAMEILDSAAVGWGPGPTAAVKADEVPSFANFADMSNFASAEEATTEVLFQSSDEKATPPVNDIKMAEDQPMDAADSSDNQCVPDATPISQSSQTTTELSTNSSPNHAPLEVYDSEANSPLMVTSKVISGFVVIDANSSQAGNHVSTATTSSIYSAESSRKAETNTTDSTSLKQISSTVAQSPKSEDSKPITENGISDDHCQQSLTATDAS